MRIIAGSGKGRILKSPIGKHTRPTADKVRAALFNSIGRNIIGSFFLDLFAGSGAVGIEALSRGAERCIFVDKSYLCVRIIKNNIQLTGFGERATIIKGDAYKILNVLPRKGLRFHYIFLDPPYQDLLVNSILAGIKKNNLLEKNGVVIVEHHKHTRIIIDHAELEIQRTKNYGDTIISYIKAL